MPYDEKLADRVREIISASETNIEEKKMFGGLCFMVNDKMCLGVKETTLMVRVDPSIFEELIENPGCKPMQHGDRISKGFLFVDIDTLQTKKQLTFWTNRALDYNRFAKPSKKRKK
jgi:TfoX/Sxy family transcriptional regulator of competence genes